MKKKSILMFLIIFILTYFVFTRFMLEKTHIDGGNADWWLHHLSRYFAFKTLSSASIAALLTWCFNGEKITLLKIILVFCFAFILTYVILNHIMLERMVYENNVIEWWLKQLRRNWQFKTGISCSVATAIFLVTYIFSKKKSVAY